MHCPATMIWTSYQQNDVCQPIHHHHRLLPQSPSQSSPDDCPSAWPACSMELHWTSSAEHNIVNLVDISRFTILKYEPTAECCHKAKLLRHRYICSGHKIFITPSFANVGLYATVLSICVTPPTAKRWLSVVRCVRQQSVYFVKCFITNNTKSSQETTIQ